MSETIYKIKNNIDNRIYIGCSKEPFRRLLKHQSLLRGNRHTSSEFQELYNSAPEDIILTMEEIKEFDDPAEARVEEGKLLNSSDNLLNTSNKPTGGDNVSNHPNREAIVKKHRDNYRRNTNFINSRVAKTNTANPNYRHGKSVEGRGCPKCGGHIGHYSNLCNTCRDRNGEKNSFYGKKHTPETRAKLSAAATGRPNLRDRKKIRVESQTYPSLTEAARVMNMNASTLAHRARSPNYPNVYYIED